MTTSRIALALGLTSLLTLGGCQAVATESYDSMAVSSPDMAVGESMEMAAVEADGKASYQSEPDVITTGYLSMTVENPSTVADEITEVVVASGGRVASRSDYTPVDYGQPSAYLDARIPSSDLDATVASITGLGEVQEISLNTVDVSLQKVDLDARIEVLDAAIQRLTTLLASAETTADLITIESALAERQAELDSLQSQRDYLSDQTLFATLSITLITPADATPSDPDGFFDGLVRGWESVLAFFAGTIVWAGILVPWLGLAIVVVGVLWAIARVRSARRQSKP
jgi:multidrug efflux pump subunit AcrA (membrane-fusion protein)